MARRAKHSFSKKPALAASGADHADHIWHMHATLKKATDKLSIGDLDGAARLSRKLLQQDPTFFGALQTLGVISLKTGQFQQAVDCFVTAASEAPADWTNYVNLSRAWIGMKKPEIAAVALREADRLNPGNAGVKRLLAETAMERRAYQEAIDLLQTALARDPKKLNAMIQLAECHQHLGNYKEATKLLLEVHRQRPDWLNVLAKLFRMPSELVDIDFPVAIGKTVPPSKNDLGLYNEMRQFLEAEIFHRAGKHEKTWELLKQANQAVHKTKRDALKAANDRHAIQLEAAKAISVLKPVPSSSVTKLATLFILGVSRSGKTTLETALAKHPAIQRGFENRNVHHAAARTSQISGLPNVKFLYELPVQLFDVFAQNYNARLKREDPQKRFYTETSPALVGEAGQLAIALPEARFVFIKRHRDDLALRVFMKNYQSGNSFAFELSSIFEYIDWYHQMIDILVEKIGERAILVEYETLVANPSLVVNQVLDLCGLDGSNVTIGPIFNDVGVALPYKSYLDAARASNGI